MFGKLMLQRTMALSRPSIRGFRFIQKNPLTQPEVKISPKEIKDQKDLPVWERVFDHRKYMEHEGPLKMTTGLSMVDVEPFPRLKLMKLYHMTLDVIRELPDEYEYKIISEELTRYRMKVVDENLNIKKIEETIAYGMIEELIFQAHSELKLLRIVQR